MPPLAQDSPSPELLARAYIKKRDRWYVHQPFARRKSTIATDVLPQLDEIATFEANADGERGGPVPIDPSRVLRVVLAGGSAAECFLLDQGATTSAVMELELKRHPMLKRDAHVGNLARSLITCRAINAIIGRVLPQLCLLYTSPSPRDLSTSRMPSSA